MPQSNHSKIPDGYERCRECRGNGCYECSGYGYVTEEQADHQAGQDGEDMDFV